MHKCTSPKGTGLAQALIAQQGVVGKPHQHWPSLVRTEFFKKQGGRQNRTEGGNLWAGGRSQGLALRPDPSPIPRVRGTDP